MRLLLFLALFAPLCSFAASSGKAAVGNAGASSPAGMISTSGGSHGGGMQNRLDPRKVPPMASDRKVNVQDCTKPIDWSAGNVKCK